MHRQVKIGNLHLFSFTSSSAAISCGCIYSFRSIQIQMSSTNRRCISFYPFHSLCLPFLCLQARCYCNRTDFEKFFKAFFFTVLVYGPHLRHLIIAAYVFSFFTSSSMIVFCGVFCDSPTLYLLLNESFFFIFNKITISLASSSCMRPVSLMALFFFSVLIHIRVRVIACATHRSYNQ